MKRQMAGFVLAMALGARLWAGSFTLSSPAFEDDGELPAKFATKKVKGGENLSPPLNWKNPPEGTKTFVIVCVDEAEVARDWVHWMVLNIPADIRSLPENASACHMPSGAEQLDNSFGWNGWGGPQPPPGTGRHPYVFTIYALKSKYNNKSLGAMPAEELYKIIKDRVLGQASLTGYFER